jgi:membrane-associated phospholipid phosphatase
VAGDVAMAVLGLLVAAVLATRRRWREARVVAEVTLGAGALVEILKIVVHRPRPPLSVQLAVETNASFPSGHTVAATAVLGVLAVLLARRSGAATVRVALPSAAAAVAVLVGLSRLYLGVHWASDILGAWLVGGCWLVLCLTVEAHLAATRARPDVAAEAVPTEP